MLSIIIGNDEVSPNPKTGMILGDGDPSATHKGNVTKFSKSLDQIRVDLETKTGSEKQKADEHDHDPGSTYPGGPPVGTGGVIAVAANAVSNRTATDGSVTGLKTASGAIGTSKTIDDSMQRSEVGEPTISSPKTINGGSTAEFAHNRGYPIPYCVFANSEDGGFLADMQDNNKIYVKNNAINPISGVYVACYGSASIT